MILPPRSQVRVMVSANLSATCSKRLMEPAPVRALHDQVVRRRTRFRVGMIGRFGRPTSPENTVSASFGLQQHRCRS